MKALLILLISTSLSGIAATKQVPAAKVPAQPSIATTSSMRSIELSGVIVKKETTTKDEAKNSEITTRIYGIRTAKGSIVRLPVSKTLDYAQFLDQSVVVTGQGYIKTAGGKKQLVLKRVSGVNQSGTAEE